MFFFLFCFFFIYFTYAGFASENCPPFVFAATVYDAQTWENLHV